MKILFYGAKDYDQQFFDKLAPEYPGITFKFIEANLYEETASPVSYTHLTLPTIA